jgi:hypothetical protein
MCVSEVRTSSFISLCLNWRYSYVSKLTLLQILKIWGFHGGDYEECRPLDVTPCGSYKHRRFVGTYHLHYHGGINRRARNNVSSNYQLKHATMKRWLHLLDWFSSPWLWRPYVLPKRRSLQEPHHVTFKTMTVFTPTYCPLPKEQAQPIH